MEYKATLLQLLDRLNRKDRYFLLGGKLLVSLYEVGGALGESEPST